MSAVVGGQKKKTAKLSEEFVCWSVYFLTCVPFVIYLFFTAYVHKRDSSPKSHVIMSFKTCMLYFFSVEHKRGFWRVLLCPKKNLFHGVFVIFEVTTCTVVVRRNKVIQVCNNVVLLQLSGMYFMMKKRRLFPVERKYP